MFSFFRSCLVSLPVIREVESQVSLFGSDLSLFYVAFMLACLFSLFVESPLGPMLRSLLSRVDIGGRAGISHRVTGRPFHHYSQCLLYTGLSGDETHPLAAFLEVLSFCHRWLYVSDCIS